MTVISTIFKTPWGLGRWIRLGIGVAFLFEAYSGSSAIIAFVGALLVYQALFNFGCGFGNNTCNTSIEPKKYVSDISKNFIYLNKKK